MDGLVKHFKCLCFLIMNWILFPFKAITDDSYPSNINQSGVILKCNGTEKTLQQCVREEVDTCNGTAGTQCRGL